MYDVTAIGELLIDFACIDVDENGYPTMKANPGGAPGNFLAALSMYGCSTAFLGKVGDDAFGRLLIGTLQKAGIETAGIVMDPTVFTTLAFVTFDETGDRSFSFARKPGADTRLTAGECKWELLDECRDFHFGSLSLTDEPVRATTRTAVARAKDGGKWISFDPNLRKDLWSSLDDARTQILWGLSQADIVKMSDDEAEFLWGCTPQEAAAKLCGEFGVKAAFVTMGADGCCFSNGSGVESLPSPDGIKAQDTTGAGDIFGGSALSRILKSGRKPEDLSMDDLRKAASFAGMAASLSTMRQGGISSVVTCDEVLARLCDE